MNFSMSEMGFLVVIGLLLFGPKKLPEIGRQIGKILAEFKRASHEFQSQLNEEVRQLEQHTDDQRQTILPPAGTAARSDFGNYGLEPNSGEHQGDGPVSGSEAVVPLTGSNPVTQGPNG